MAPKRRNLQAYHLWNSLYLLDGIDDSLRAIAATRWTKTKVARLVDKLKTALEKQERNPKKQDLLIVEDEDVILDGRKLWGNLYRLTKAKRPLDALYNKGNTKEEAAKILAPLLTQALQQSKDEFLKWGKVWNRKDFEKMTTYYRGESFNAPDDDNIAEFFLAIEDIGLRMEGIEMFNERELRSPLNSWLPSEDHTKKFFELIEGLPIETLRLFMYAFGHSKTDTNEFTSRNDMLKDLKSYEVETSIMTLRAWSRWLAGIQTGWEGTPVQQDQSTQDSPEQPLGNEGEACVKPSRTEGHRRYSSESDMSGLGEQSDMNVQLWNEVYTSEDIRSLLKDVVAQRWRKTKFIRLVNKLAIALREPAEPSEGEVSVPLRESVPVKDADLKLRGIPLWKSLYTLTKATSPLQTLYDRNKDKSEPQRILTRRFQEALQELVIEFNCWNKLQYWRPHLDVDILEDVSFHLDTLFSTEDLRTVNTAWAPSNVQITRFKGIAGIVSNDTLRNLILSIKTVCELTDRSEKEITDTGEKVLLGEFESFMPLILKFFCGMMSARLAEGKKTIEEADMTTETSYDSKREGMFIDCFFAFQVWHILYDESDNIQTLLKEVVAGHWNDARAIRLIEKLATTLGKQEKGPGQKPISVVQDYVLQSRDRGLWNILFELTKAYIPFRILLKDGEIHDTTIHILIQRLEQALQELQNEFRNWERLQDKQELENMWQYVGGAIPEDDDEDWGEDAMSEDDEENEEEDDNYTRSVLESVGLNLQGIFSNNDLQASLKIWEPQETHIEVFLEIVKKLPVEKSIYLLDYANYVSNKEESKTPMGMDAVLEELRPVSKVPLRIFRALLKWLAGDATPGETVPGNSSESEQFVPDSPEQSSSDDGQARVKSSGTVRHRRNSCASDWSESTIVGDQSVMNVQTFREQVLSTKKPRDLDEYLDLIFAQESETAERIFLEICYGSGGPLGMLDICKTLLPKYVEANRQKANRLCDQDKLLETGSCGLKWSSGDCENVKNTGRAPKRIEQNQKIETSEKKEKTTRAPRQPKETTNEPERQLKVPQELKEPNESAASPLSEEELEFFKKYGDKRKFHQDILVETLAALDPNLDLRGRNLRELYNEWRRQFDELTRGDNNTTMARRRRCPR